MWSRARRGESRAGTARAVGTVVVVLTSLAVTGGVVGLAAESGRSERADRDYAADLEQPAPTPPGGVSTCCNTSTSPGCDDPVCEAAVCAVDPFCCDTAWDVQCVTQAPTLCCTLCSPAPDCNGNGIPDDCDIADGGSTD